MEFYSLMMSLAFSNAHLTRPRNSVDEVFAEEVRTGQSIKTLG